MDPCEQLRHDLQDARAERDGELDRARRRFWLGLFGLEFVLDWQERTAVDRALGGFLALVQTGEVVLAVDQLFRILQALARSTGRTAAARAIGGIAGRFLGLAALGLLVMDVAAGYDRWMRTQRRIEERFTARTGALHAEAAATCGDVERIFREEGVALP
jgi:hypothetical protein